MNLFNKVKWALAVSGIFLIILATNLIDKKNFLRVEESVENIYTERLLAKELLLDLSILFHKKELAYALNDTTYLQSKNELINTKITQSLEMFNRSGKTKQEKYILDVIKKNHAKLIQIESNANHKDSSYSIECAGVFSAINNNLNDLANEQMKEGKNQKRLASDAVNSVKLFSKIEIYMLILLALMLQVIILYNPKK
ncbi:MAG: hypothetical protein P1U41_06820 [Vicingaceae bacterium]|nr:hypothetical protein [Vicingaceae bacterium]